MFSRLKALWGTFKKPNDPIPPEDADITKLALARAENARLRQSHAALERELEDTRKDLRAAVNNLLSQAGAPPLPPHEEIKPPANMPRRLSHHQRQRLYALATMPKPAEKKEGTNG
jgi:hypothetical protein